MPVCAIVFWLGLGEVIATETVWRMTEARQRDVSGDRGLCRLNLNMTTLQSLKS
jgi:hypothetical protein